MKNLKKTSLAALLLCMLALAACGEQKPADKERGNHPRIESRIHKHLGDNYTILSQVEDEDHHPVHLESLQLPWRNGSPAFRCRVVSPPSGRMTETSCAGTFSITMPRIS